MEYHYSGCFNIPYRTKELTMKKPYLKPQAVEWTNMLPANAGACEDGGSANITCRTGNSVSAPGSCILGWTFYFGSCQSGANPTNCSGGSTPQYIAVL